MNALGDDFAMAPWTANGIELRSGHAEWGELESLPSRPLSPAALRERFAADGYLLSRSLLPTAAATAARRAVLAELQRLGFVAPETPIEEARPNGRLADKRVLPALGDLPEVRELLRSPPLVALFEQLLEGAVRMLDHVWVRMVPPGHSTTPHCDIVYMGRGTQRLCTAWVALSDVPRRSGALMVLERSHQLEQLRERYWQLDVDRDRLWNRVRLRHWKLVREGKYSSNPRGVQREFKRRWLSTDYRAGDVLVFSAFLMHASLDNTSDRIRATLDARWQRADEPADERWIGPSPIGHR